MSDIDTLYVMQDVFEERRRQDRKWNEQNHPDGTSSEDYGPDAVYFKERNEQAVRKGTLAWDLILLEEVFEALEQEDPVKLREELIQVAAVAACWVECIDRRTS